VKGLRVGDRVRTRGQRYHFAYLWGTGSILEVSENGEDYRVRHDANTRIGLEEASFDWHPHHHILQADVQFRDVVFDYIPYVNAQDCKRLLEIGFQKNVHFRLVDEREDHLPIG
jgi:hypothetical protein